MHLGCTQTNGRPFPSVHLYCTYYLELRRSILTWIYTAHLSTRSQSVPNESLWRRYLISNPECCDVNGILILLKKKNEDQRLRVCDYWMHSHKWDTVPPSAKLRRGKKNNVRAWGQGLVLWNTVFQAWQSHCSTELTTTMITYTRSAQDWSCRCPMMEGRGTHRSHPSLRIYTLLTVLRVEGETRF